MKSATAITIRNLHPSLGAEVGGVDLSKPIDAQTAAAICKAFDDNIVIVVRNQTLDEPQQQW